LFVRSYIHRQERRTEEQKERKETFRRTCRAIRLVAAGRILFSASSSSSSSRFSSFARFIFPRISKDEFSSVRLSRGKVQDRARWEKGKREKRGNDFSGELRVVQALRRICEALLLFLFPGRGFFARFWLFRLGKRSIGAISPIDFVLHAACDAAANYRGVIHFPPLRWIRTSLPIVR
jgi:hypothetical protein